MQEIGPGMAALMLLLVPLLWSLPEVLIVGELSSMLPVEGRVLSLGRSRLRKVLGIPERLADLDVFAGGHGDLPDPVQPVPRLVRPRPRVRRALAHRARCDLGADADQPAGGGARRSNLDRRRALHHRRFRGRLPRRDSEHRSQSARAVRRCRWRRWQWPRGRTVHRLVELHRLGQRVDGGRGSEGCRPHLSHGARDHAPPGHGRILPATAHNARRDRLDDVARRRMAGDREQRRRRRRIRPIHGRLGGDRRHGQRGRALQRPAPGLLANSLRDGAGRIIAPRARKDRAQELRSSRCSSPPSSTRFSPSCHSAISSSPTSCSMRSL